jgi:hypothetical protein
LEINPSPKTVIFAGGAINTHRWRYEGAQSRGPNIRTLHGARKGGSGRHYVEPKRPTLKMFCVYCTTVWILKAMSQGKAEHALLKGEFLGKEKPEGLELKTGLPGQAKLFEPLRQKPGDAFGCM